MEVFSPGVPGRTPLALALCASLGWAGGAAAQAPGAQPSLQLEEVIVTAQKRLQSLQDVPVAVTALGQEALEVNRVLSVNDLNGLAPNFGVRPAVGGVNIPAFNMRGITSYGLVAGSDKQISVYLDGVYIGSPRGSIFNLPDIERIEVLRGPQGTLFGRNATGGAVSINTRDPSGELGFRQLVGLGNRDYQRTVSTIDFPSVGPFSAYFTYTREEQDGDIDNLGAGVTWDRSAFGFGRDKTAKTLGSIDQESFFLAAMLELDRVSLSYKFDYSEDAGTPRANVMVSDIDAARLGPQAELLLDSLQAANPDLLNQGTNRPDAVNNAFSLPRDQTVEGHRLHLEWEINDAFALKNTLAYRKTDVFTPADISGTSGWVAGSFAMFLPGGPFSPDDPFCFICSQSDSDGDQWSNELQLDYSGESLELTAGLLYYTSDDTSGSPPDSANLYGPSSVGVFPGYVAPRYAQNVSYNEADSYAAYLQAEYRLSDSIGLLAGVRYTEDDKSGSFVSGLPEDAPTEKNPGGGYWVRDFDYSDDHVDYLLGVNYHLNDATMVYGKYSTAYVSGGSVAGIAFDPEESDSWELGFKADFFDSRVRANFAWFDVTYENFQAPTSGAGFTEATTAPELFEQIEGVGTFILGGGELQADGFELEVSVLPLSGLVVSASLGYVNTEFTEANPYALESVGAIDLNLADGDNAYPNSAYEQTLNPEWNGNLALNYSTDPLFNSAYLDMGLSGIWTDRIRLEQNPGRAAATPFGEVEFAPAQWVFNARVALRSIALGDSWTGEISLWGRNLTDEENIAFVTNFGAFVSGNFQDSRSYGIDFVVDFD